MLARSVCSPHSCVKICVLPPQPPATVCQRPGWRKRAAFARCRQEDHQDGDEDDGDEDQQGGDEDDEGEGELDDGDVLLNYMLNNEKCSEQGGRSCTGARVAPAEKFGLGQKF